MEFNIKKDWLKFVVTLFAITTAFTLGNNILSHANQMYIFSALVVYLIWIKKK